MLSTVHVAFHFVLLVIPWSYRTSYHFDLLDDRQDAVELLTVLERFAERSMVALALVIFILTDLQVILGTSARAWSFEEMNYVVMSDLVRRPRYVNVQVRSGSALLARQHAQQVVIQCPLRQL